MAARTRRIFEPIESREAALPPHYNLNMQYDPKDPMGNMGICNITDVIYSWLIGFTYYDEALPRWIDWIDKAFERDEEFGVSIAQYHTHLYQARALGKWLLNGTNDTKDWENAYISLEKWWQEGCYGSKGVIVTEGLDDYMAYAYQAEKYEEGIAMYEKLRGKSPISLSKTLSPRKLAYAHCLNKLGIKKFDEEKLFEAGRKMLQWNLEGEWLALGGDKTAAMWLKIVYWHKDKTLTPFQTVLKAYDNMPRVKKPDFIIDIENPNKWSAIKAFFRK